MRIKNLFFAPILMLTLTGAVACGSSKKTDDTQAVEKKTVTGHITKSTISNVRAAAA